MSLNNGLETEKSPKKKLLVFAPVASSLEKILSLKPHDIYVGIAAFIVVPKGTGVSPSVCATLKAVRGISVSEVILIPLLELFLSPTVLLLTLFSTPYTLIESITTLTVLSTRTSVYMPVPSTSSPSTPTSALLSHNVKYEGKPCCLLVLS